MNQTACAERPMRAASRGRTPISASPTAPTAAARKHLRIAALDSTPRSLVTNDPQRAGLSPHTVFEARGGRARGIACGGPAGNTILTVPAGQHGIVLGRTGSGKTRLVIEPTIVVNAQRGRRAGERQPHLISLDCKGTIYRETASLLKAQGYRLRVFDLAAATSPDRWNPLTAMHRALAAGNDGEADQVIARLASVLKDTVRDDADRYWAEAAWDAITGIARALSQRGDHEPTFAEVQATLADTARLVALDRILDERSPSGLHAAAQLTGVERTWSCVRSTAAAMLAYFCGASGAAVSASSTIDMTRDLFDDPHPCAYYIIVPDTSRVADLYAALLIDTLYHTYCAEHDRRHLEDAPGARRMLFVLDEFARLPRLDVTAAMSAGRSRGVTVLLALQSIAQLTERGIYSADEARVMLEQAAATIYLSVTSPEAGRDAQLKSGGVVTERDLMLLPRGQAFVSVAGHPMIKTHLEPLPAWEQALTSTPSRKE